MRDQGQRCGTPGRAKPDMSNALAEGISRDQGVCLELSRGGPEVTACEPLRMVLTCGFLLRWFAGAAVTAGATGSSRYLPPFADAATADA